MELMETWDNQIAALKGNLQTTEKGGCGDGVW